MLHETTDQASLLPAGHQGAVVQVDRVEDLYADVVRAGRLAMQAPAATGLPRDARPTCCRRSSTRPPRRRTRSPRCWSTPVLDALAAALAAPSGRCCGPAAARPPPAPSAPSPRLAARLGAPVLYSYGGRGLLPPDHPHLVPLPPHARRPARSGTPPTWCSCVGSDLDAMNTQGFRQPRPPRAASVVDLVAPVNYEPDMHVPVDARGRAAAAARRCCPQPRARGRPVRRPATSAGPMTASSTRSRRRCPTDAVVVADMCVAGYWYGGFGRVGAAARARLPGRLGHPGLRLPGRARHGLSGRPDGRARRGRRLPVRLRRPGDRGAGAAPGHGRAGRRRRLRHAALRLHQGRRAARRHRARAARLRRAGARLPGRRASR